MNERETAWTSNFKSTLESLNGNYNYIVQWDTEIIKDKKKDDEKITIDDTDVYIVLTKLPSLAYGSNITSQQMQITVLTIQKNIADVVNVLTSYQEGKVNNKYTLSGYYVKESWYSPQVSENFIEQGLNKYATITMDGSVAFTSSALDISSITFGTQVVKPIQCSLTTTADSLSSRITGQTTTKAINRSITFKVDIKAIAVNNDFTTKAIDWMSGTIGKNNSYTLMINFSNSTSISKTVIFESANYLTTEGTLPVITATLIEAV